MRIRACFIRSCYFTVWISPIIIYHTYTHLTIISDNRTYTFCMKTFLPMPLKYIVRLKYSKIFYWVNAMFFVVVMCFQFMSITIHLNAWDCFLWFSFPYHWIQCIPPPFRNTSCGNRQTLPNPIAYPMHASVNSNGLSQLPRSCILSTSGLWPLFVGVLWPEIIEFFCNGRNEEEKKNTSEI